MRQDLVDASQCVQRIVLQQLTAQDPRAGARPMSVIENSDRCVSVLSRTSHAARTEGPLAETLRHMHRTRLVLDATSAHVARTAELVGRTTKLLIPRFHSSTGQGHEHGDLRRAPDVDDLRDMQVRGSTGGGSPSSQL